MACDVNKNRGRQFAAAAPRKGLEAALSRREARPAQRRVLGEEAANEVNDVLLRLDVSDTVHLVYYTKNGYTPLNGTIRKISKTYKYFETEDRRIYFEDILQIRRD